MLRNDVNYKGLYGNLRTCFGIENKGHELEKKMAYLVSSVSCQCLCAVFWPFQRDLVGFRFADFLSIYNLPDWSFWGELTAVLLFGDLPSLALQ